MDGKGGISITILIPVNHHLWTAVPFLYYSTSYRKIQTTFSKNIIPYSSVLKASNIVDDKEIQRSMGHKDLRTTMNSYMYAMTRDTEAIGKFEAALYPSEKSVIPCNTKLIDFSTHKKGRTPA